MTDHLITPPVLSTPDAHILEDPAPATSPLKWKSRTDEDIYNVYEIARTAEEIRKGAWRRIALQFPDSMLHDAPRVFEALQSTLDKVPGDQLDSNPKEQSSIARVNLVDVTKDFQKVEIREPNSSKVLRSRRQLCILADTSYGACCVDEIAAEHVDADVVVHYGRSCLSPTARLPVIYVFTSQPLLHGPLFAAFEVVFPQKDSKIILLADTTYSDHVPAIYKSLQRQGYSNLFAPSIIHDPSSPLPNRTIPPPIVAGDDSLNNFSLFHISDPPESLLLTLSSRVQSMYIYPTTDSASSTKVLQAQTSRQLRRRYGLLTSLNTCSIFGILVNTLSVKNYLATISKIRAQITAAGKKSYTFVVGKINAAKVANFSEIGGWVVVGCWESSLIESKEFYRPIITPFELQLALMSDEERVWTGEWTGDFSSILTEKPPIDSKDQIDNNLETGNEDANDEEDSAPPEFDLRTGRYVSHSRPMKNFMPLNAELSTEARPSTTSSALTKRAKGEVATINGIASPGAEYLRSQRTWKGLGSDFEIAYEDEEKGAAVEQGRSGVARGYSVGNGEERR